MSATVTEEEYLASQENVARLEADYRAAQEATKVAKAAEESLREPWCVANREHHHLRTRWELQQALTGTERRWLDRLAAEPKWRGGWRDHERSKTEDRMRGLGYALVSDHYLVVTDLGRAKLAEVPPKKSKCAAGGEP